MLRNPLAYVTKLLPLCILLVSGVAHGQMVPLQDLRRNSADAWYYDTEDWQDHYPPIPFGYWEDFIDAHAQQFIPCDPPVPPPNDQCLMGETFGHAYQIGQFFPAGIQFSGTVAGSWAGVPSGLFSIGAGCGFKFRLDNPVDYDLFMDVDPGDVPKAGFVHLAAYSSGGTSEIYYHESGPLQVSGRLGPGTYVLEANSAHVGTEESYNGLTYSAQFTVTPPPQPHIAFQPSDHSSACGGTVVFSVGTTLPPSNYTFQWRKNFVPLANGSGVAGATTPNLTLGSVCSEDDYDVVVTGPDVLGGAAVAEPSRLAHLSIVTATGIASEPTSPAVVRAPAPNPFRSSTSVAYEAPEETRLVATVFNASGVRIRSLADRTVSGAGSITWDGRLTSGAHAPVGIYFLRVDLGALHQTRKVALLQ